MIRKSILTASVLMMAMSAFAVERGREKDDTRDSVQAPKDAGQVVDQNRMNSLAATADLAASSGDEGAGVMQKLVHDPGSQGLSGTSLNNMTKVVARADELKGTNTDAASATKAMDQALAEAGIDKQELIEKCGGK